MGASRPCSYLPPVAGVLLLGEAHGFDLYFEIPVSEIELPVRLYGLRDDFDHALPELGIGQPDIAFRDLHAGDGCRRRRVRATKAA